MKDEIKGGLILIKITKTSRAGNMGDGDSGRQGYMGGYGGLLGIIGQQRKNPLFLVKKFKIETAILFLSFFWSKITIFW